MGKWSGIVGSALAGGLAGAGQAVSAIGAQQIKSDEEKATRTWQEARELRMNELRQKFQKEMQADQQMFTVTENDERRRVEESNRDEDRNARSMENAIDRDFKSGESEKDRKSREKIENAREGRYRDQDKNRSVDVVEKDGTPRIITQQELNSAPSGKYRRTSTANQESRLESQEEKSFAARIDRKAAQIPNLSKRDQAIERQVLAEMKSAYREQFGKPYAGSASTAPNDPLGWRTAK